MEHPPLVERWGAIVSATYTVYLSDAFGNRLEAVDNFVDDGGASFSYTRVANAIGTFQLNLPAQYAYLFRDPAKWLDMRVEFWRRPTGGVEYLDTGTLFFVRKVRRRPRSRSLPIQIAGPSAVELLSRRHVAAAAKAALATKTDQIDDMMKAVVREQLGASASATRTISTYLSVEPDLTLGSATTKAFSRDNVLAVLQDLAKESGTTSVPLFFDIVALASNSLQFQVRAKQWEQDRTATNGGQRAVILSADDEMLTNVLVEEDYLGEVNDVYMGGPGQASKRTLREVTDPTRIGYSPLNLREAFVSLTNTNANAPLDSIGYATLREGRPKKVFTADIQDSNAARYGVQWFFGSKLTASVDADQFDCRVDSVTISMQAGKETVKAGLRSEA